MVAATDQNTLILTMAEGIRGSRRTSARRGSGFLASPSSDTSDQQMLHESLERLWRVTSSITTNVRNINTYIERILLDKADIEELETMLSKIIGK